MKRFGEKRLRQFQARLREWFKRNKRAMPWRGTRDPYRIWLSEVMLQQTRVSVVADYYKRFLARFPTVQALAGARSEEVLQLWAGLGYYTRARNLHAAAKKVVHEWGGKFPAAYERLRDLPGVGTYTAAAIASIAYGHPHAVLDGNVARVLSRIFVVRGDLRAPRRWAELQRMAQGLLPVARAGRAAFGAGDWNQAMMELGATVCTPQLPACVACPVAGSCAARKLGIVDKVPEVRKKRAAVDVHLAALVMTDPHGHTLLLREGNELFSKMWQFPSAPVNGSARKAALKIARIHAGGSNRAGTGALVSLPTVRHTFTYRKVTLHPFWISVKKLPNRKGTRAVYLDRLDALGVSSATNKVAARAIQQIHSELVATR